MNNINQYREQAAYVYRSTLKSRYLMNEKWIARFGPSDKQVPNPHHRFGPPASLYSVARVEEFLDVYAREYAEHLVVRAKRSIVMTAVAETKRQELLEWARNVKIEHDPWPTDLWETCQCHLASLYRNSVLRRVPEVSPRHILNMLRHAHTNYETLLDDTNGKTGAAFTYTFIKGCINAEIATRLYACGINVSETGHRVAA
jgi:hypothetical protein